jgi:hypothetical protein
MATTIAAKKPKIHVNENGLTVVEPIGRMTHALLTRYQVGDKVLVTQAPEDLAEIGVEPGQAGIIRGINVCDPNDGDETALYFDVKLDEDGCVVSMAEYELAPFSAVEAWLGRRLAAQLVSPTVRQIARARG